ncbi:cupin domain-containing protein [Frisingicoccus sp.]
MVVDGEGRLTYDGEVYDLRKGDCVFIDCKMCFVNRNSSKSEEKFPTFG